MYLTEMLDGDLLLKMRTEGYVKEQFHPTEPYVILNYTDKTTYDRVWNPVTHACRGLIYHIDTQKVIARPFPKFFNYGEYSEGTLDLDAQAIVTDKMDGSLGILYRLTNGSWAIATRGSFTSGQAVHATRIWQERYAHKWAYYNDVTELFEIIWPQNRIVLDYGDVDDLFHLGAVHIETGETFAPLPAPAPCAENMAVYTLREALALPPRKNAEGVVVHFINDDKRVKIKQEDYVRLHRIITGMNARTVWEALGEGKTADELCEGLPEEFWPWIHDVSNELLGKADDTLLQSELAYRAILIETGGAASRKEFAELAKLSEYRAFLFLLLDGRDVKTPIWKTIKPSGDRALAQLDNQ